MVAYVHQVHMHLEFSCQPKRLVACHSLWSLAILKLLVACEPPDCHLLHFGKREVLARINSMEVEYNEILHWEAPGPAVPGELSTTPNTPWGEGIQLAGIIQLLKGNQATSLMADSYSFQSQEELLRVRKYLKDHGGWQLRQVS